MKTLRLAAFAMLTISCAATAPISQPQAATTHIQATCPPAAEPVVASSTDTFTVSPICPGQVAHPANDYCVTSKTENSAACKHGSTVQVKLHSFGTEITTGIATDELTMLGYRPATHAELEGLMAKYPGKRKAWTVALGSIYSASDCSANATEAEYVPVAGREKKVSLWFADWTWSNDTEFAVVKDPNAGFTPSGTIRKLDATYKAKLTCDLKEAIKKAKQPDFMLELFGYKLPPIRCKEGEEVEIHLFRITKGRMTSNLVHHYLQSLGYRLANWAEALALLRKKNKIHRQAPIAALGSPWKLFPHEPNQSLGNKNFLHLPTASDELYEIGSYYVELTKLSDTWREGWTFAAVRAPLE